MTTQRILAVLSAILLVSAVALAMVGPRAVSLEIALLQIDRGLVEGLRGATVRFLGPWTWSHIMVPVLIRPVWLLPAGLGLILTGIALSIPNRNNPRRSTRRS